MALCVNYIISVRNRLSEIELQNDHSNGCRVTSHYSYSQKVSIEAKCGQYIITIVVSQFMNIQLFHMAI